MSENKLDSIVEDLKREEERLKGELADLKKQAQEIAKDLKTVQSGLAGLAGKTALKTRKRSAAKQTASQEAPEAVDNERQGEMALESFP